VNDRGALLQEILALLSAPERGEARPSVSHLDYVLTSGYAHALSLEAEHLRLERQLEAALRRLGADEDATEEVAALALRISAAEGDLTHLRSLLQALSGRARAARAAA
jgi:hypothetical protein